MRGVPEDSRSNRGRDEIYDALVARASEGRMGGPITLGDLDRGLLGDEGRRHLARVRGQLGKAHIPYDETDTCSF